MKPGDLITWYYKVRKHVVAHDDTLWSSPMKCWVPIGGLHLLISINDTHLTFIPLWHRKWGARLCEVIKDDIWGSTIGSISIADVVVVPRVYNDVHPW
jgi:hypothetical protein